MPCICSSAVVTRTLCPLDGIQIELADKFLFLQLNDAKKKKMKWRAPPTCQDLSFVHLVSASRGELCL